MLLGIILLGLTWAALRGDFSLGNLLIGNLLGYLIMAGLARGGVLPQSYRDRVPAVIGLVWFLAKEFLLANLRMAIEVVQPTSRLSPGIIRVPLDVTDEYEILLLSTLINLTPGSLALELTRDRRAMYVHVMNVTDPDAARAHIKDHFERRVLAVLR